MTTALDAPAVEDGSIIDQPPVEGFPLDKSMWSDGPWQTEPDYEPYSYNGYDCLIMRTTIGTLSGYIAVPSEHPWYTLSAEHVPVLVHGGLEWTGAGNDLFRRASREDVVWFGFSCGHIGDYYPVDELIYKFDPRMDRNEQITRKEQYKTIEYVKFQIKYFCDEAVRAMAWKTASGWKTT
jgi:hypothetical protein